MGFNDKLLRLRRFRLARELMMVLYSVEVPASVKIGHSFQMPHRANGLVVYGNTIIGDRVKIFHQVTIGRGDAHLPAQQRQTPPPQIEIRDDVVLCPGAKVIAGSDMIVGRGTIVTANSVLTKSTGDFEIWSGNPARHIAQAPKSRCELPP